MRNNITFGGTRKKVSGSVVKPQTEQYTEPKTIVLK